MKRLLSLLLFGAVAVGESRADGNVIDLTTPDGAVAAARKLYCTTIDGEPVYWSWRGDVYARRAGEKDRLLFRVEGLNVRTCASAQDQSRGRGFRSLSRELLVYLDPESEKPLAKWTNPWTNESVDVLHVANDPVNSDFFPRATDGAPFQWRGHVLAGDWFLTTTIPLFYRNPLGGDYQSEIGGAYHAAEMFNFMGDLKSLTEKASSTADVRVGWVRISDWLPWMKMNGREGLIYMHTAGRKLLKWEDVPEAMRNLVSERYPLYRNPPPLDDRRPNVTSWSYYKAVREGRAARPKGD